MKQRSVVVAVFVCILVTLAGAAESFTGKVVGVVDGDTLSVLRDGWPITIRLDGIDAPENHQAFGSKAKQFVSDATFGKDVTVSILGKDRYGRALGRVVLSNGTTLNTELLREGLAWWYWQHSSDTALAMAEATAKVAKRGLWSDAQSMPPWQFRAGGSRNVLDTSPASPETTTALPVHDTRPDIQSPSRRTSTQEATVYITRTGAKFHTAGCSSLRYSAYPLKRSEAISRGYGACLRCSP